MDIAVIGSNMVDLITYINQMPKEGKRWKRQHSKLVVGVKVRIRPLLLQNSILRY